MYTPSTVSYGCTTGVIRLPDGFLFFKNRDLEGAYLAERTTVFQSTDQAHVLRGMNLKTGELQGVSIGINHHRVCVANTHVASTPGVTYDLLCESILQETREQEDVPRIVERFVTQNTVQGGRILVSAGTWTTLVEIFEKQAELAPVEPPFVMTNTFSMIPHTPDRPQILDESSTTRLEVASREIRVISNVRGLKAMLRSHLPEKGDLSICNHRSDGGGTETSHIIQVQGNYVGWSWLIGFPCQNDYTVTQLFT